MKKNIGFFLIIIMSTLFLSSNILKRYHLKSKFDKKNNITWYMHKKNYGTNSMIYLYIGKNHNNNGYFLRMGISYCASSRLFIDKYLFTLDKEEFILTPRKTIQTREIRGSNLPSGNAGYDSRGICEVYDVQVNQEEFNLMEKISRSKIGRLRFEGIKGYKKKKIHKTTKKALTDVLNAYKELLGINKNTKNKS